MSATDFNLIPLDGDSDNVLIERHKQAQDSDDKPEPPNPDCDDKHEPPQIESDTPSDVSAGSLLTRKVLREELQRFGEKTLKFEIKELQRFYTESLADFKSYVPQTTPELDKDNDVVVRRHSLASLGSLGSDLPLSLERPPQLTHSVTQRFGTGSALASSSPNMFSSSASPWSFEIRRRNSVKTKRTHSSSEYGGSSDGSRAPLSIAGRKLENPRADAEVNNMSGDMDAIGNRLSQFSAASDTDVLHDGMPDGMLDVAAPRTRVLSYRSETSNGGHNEGELMLKRLSVVSGVMQHTLSQREYMSRVEEFVRRGKLDLTSTLFIISNILVLGVQAEFGARDPNADEHPFFIVLEGLFLIAFSVELGLRIYVFQISFFLWRPGAMWNYFDIFVVTTQLIDFCGALVARVSDDDDDGSGAPGFSVFRVLRILRMVRILRLVRIMHLIGEVRAIVVAILSSMKSLAWTLFLLFCLVYSFSVLLLQIVTAQRASEDGLQDGIELEDYFGSFGRSLLTLFQMITGGIDWNDVTQALMDGVSPWMALVVSLYIAFVIFALMNVVTGVFVDSALRSTKVDQDQQLMARIHQIIKDTSTDETDGISWELFKVQLETPAMKNLFKALELDTAEARDLFRLIDIDDSGEISSEELIYGCFKLRGNARAIHMHAFIFEYLQFAYEMRAHAQFVQQTLNSLVDGQQLQKEMGEKTRVDVLESAKTTFLESSKLMRQFSPAKSAIKGFTELSV